MNRDPEGGQAIERSYNNEEEGAIPTVVPSKEDAGL
jgi:hypothetical protein